MKYCEKCHSGYTDDMIYCTTCGSKLVDKPLSTDRKGAGDQGGITKPEKKGGAGKIIKRVVIGIVVALVVIFLWGSHLMNSTTYVVLNSEGECFAKGGGASEVGIDYDGYVWEVSYKPSWVVVDEYEDSFHITCLPNYTGEDREDHITVKSGKVVQMLPVAQYGKARRMRLSEKSVKKGVSGGSVQIAIDTDGTGPEVSYPDFCDVSALTPEGFTLRVSKNDGYTRTGTLYVMEDNAKATIHISQEGKCVSCNGNGRKTCTSCMGTGQVGWGYYSSICYLCHGAGEVECHMCSGTGVR